MGAPLTDLYNCRKGPERGAPIKIRTQNNIIVNGGSFIIKRKKRGEMGLLQAVQC